MIASRRLAPLLLLLAGLALCAALVLTPWVVQAQSRDVGSDFILDAANGYPTGIWSDGTTLWVADFEDHKLYAYRMSDRSRDSGKDFNTLSAAGNKFPAGKSTWRPQAGQIRLRKAREASPQVLQDGKSRSRVFQGHQKQETE